MNRISVGSSNDNISVIKDEEVLIDIKENINILIENTHFSKYKINVYNSNLNIFVIDNNIDSINFEVNIYGGNVSFNNISSYSYFDLNVNLNKENSNIFVYNSVISDKKIKYNINIKHNKKLTNSNVYNNGVTKDLGTILFEIISCVPINSKDCIVNQSSKIITLNDINDNEINPILLIDEFECVAKHSAFIGNFNKNELFYLMSRGLSKIEAMKLLISGMLIGTLDICFNEKEKLKIRLNEMEVI